MLLLGSSFAKIPLLSLRIGRPVGSIVGHLINPHTLKIDALWCKLHTSKKPMLLTALDIREMGPKGIIVNDVDVAIDPDEAVRLKPIIDLNYDLIDKKVISGHLSIGRVADYAVDQTSMYIQKIYVEPSLLGRLKSSRLTIDRTQIIEVSPTYVKVAGGEKPVKKQARRRLAQSPLSPMPAGASTSLTKE
jgi:hypothetical protein